ncbi:family 20 glycosylhydrolase [Arenibacter echinorum]|uniref:Glycosyl hydrolase family 20 n=1 Tax=Arenibacter echinorum TaxID=440515 RepID=A0A327QR27_9FLAO|nr:family 20 glycosylhydrolase [Arenibacter echinorum]RAJ07046.1 glycosyl hydrolase family 20 [Arenibacter echinorum]
MGKLLLIFLSIGFYFCNAQDIFEVKGLCIAAPHADGVAEFVKFVDEELGPNGINTLALRVDFNYAYESRPELRGNNPLSKVQIKELVAVAKKHNINLIPQVNLFGHQSWAEKTNKLLEVYPQFDETPHVKIPVKYEWPNADGLYCKSYCPLHPEVHNVVFDLVDEIIAVFEAKAFHAGMDEVFYIADEKCPRCQGKDPAAIFANEVNKISRHLEMNSKRLWIWGDRLIDASTSGIGMWEASMNNTARAIDLIDKSVVICDWHYERALPTPALFALKGLDVIACPWKKPEVAREQVKMMYNFRENASPEMKKHFLGMMHTVWSSASEFIKSYHSQKAKEINPFTQEACFRAMLAAIKDLELIGENTN